MNLEQSVSGKQQKKWALLFYISSFYVPLSKRSQCGICLQNGDAQLVHFIIRNALLPCWGYSFIHVWIYEICTFCVNWFYILIPNESLLYCNFIERTVFCSFVPMKIYIILSRLFYWKTFI